jgi:branched-chain amino acid transport system substrate-binding protein
MLDFLSKSSAIFCAIALSCATINSSNAAGTPIENQQTQSVDVHVGIYAPFSSQSAFIGRNILAAMEIANGQLKPSPIHYSFYTLDQQPKSNHTDKVLQKFITTHEIKVLVTAGKENGLVAEPVTKQNNVIHLNVLSNSVVAENNTIEGHHMSLKFITQFEKDYWTYPSKEAGYAYEAFQLLNKSIASSMSTHGSYAKQTVMSKFNSLVKETA